jgi:transcription initiation factor IIE alpha subunit
MVFDTIENLKKVCKKLKEKNGYCDNCGEKLKPTEQIENGFVCQVCGSVYLKKENKFEFYY